MSLKTVAYVRSLAELFPSLRPFLDEHIHDNFGEVLPHMFLCDVTRYVISLLTAIEGDVTGTRRRELHDILEHIERTYAEGDEELQDLISVSFLENLPYPDEPGARIRRMLGPNLSRQLDEIG